MSEVERAVEVLKEAGWQWTGGTLRPTWMAQELARELVNQPTKEWVREGEVASQ